jgi:DNA-binding transcriptional regulator GbsR (MarR family)
MSSELDRLVEQATDAFAEQGFPRTPAAVLMALMASDDGALEAGELTARLGISPAAVSGAVRYLVQLRFVRIGAVRGTRRHRYFLVDETWYAGSLRQTDRYAQLAALVEAALPSDPDSPGLARFSEMAAFFRFLERRMPALFEEWRATR